MLARTRTFQLSMTLSLALLVVACGSASPPGARRSSGTTPTTAPISSPTPPSTQVIQALWMIDAATGWALTSEDHRLLHTTDGGTSWRDVTPPYSRSTQAMEVVAAVLSAALAWVAIAPDNGTPPTQVYRTTDGGQTWQMAPVPTTSQLGQLTFLDPQHGWLLAGIQAAAGPKAGDVFRTTDGGTTWINVSSASPTYTSPGALPPGAEWLTFLDVSTGWATGYSPASHFVWLYVTHDGGSTWHHQTLLLPAQVQDELFTGPTTFFKSRHGVLPLCAEASTTTFYVTDDAGATWKSVSTLPVCTYQTDFLDVDHGWVTGGTTLYATSDGGRSWTKIIPEVTSKSTLAFAMLDFVSNEIGWAIGSAPGSAFLLKTVDGGRTWTQVPYTIS